MKRTLILVPALLFLLACGKEDDQDVMQRTWDTFVAAGHRGDWKAWAGCLDPLIEEGTTVAIGSWLVEKSTGTPVAARAHELLDEYGYRSGDIGDWARKLESRAEFLDAAIPLVLSGMKPGQADGLLPTLVPPPGRLHGLLVTGKSATAVVGEGESGHRVVFHWIDGTWRVFSFGETSVTVTDPPPKHR